MSPQAFKPASVSLSPRWSLWPGLAALGLSVLLCPLFSPLTVALAGPTFLPPPSAKCPFPHLHSPPSLSAAPAASDASSSASRSGCHPEGLPYPHPADLPPPSPRSSAPPPTTSASLSLSSLVHFFSVFCPCGKARLSAASCPTLLHLRPPSGPLVDGGVEPVETVSRSHSQAAGTSPDPGCSEGTSVFLPWASFPLKAHGGWRAWGSGKESQC